MVALPNTLIFNTNIPGKLHQPKVFGIEQFSYSAVCKIFIEVIQYKVYYRITNFMIYRNSIQQFNR